MTGEDLKALRARTGLSQEQFAVKVLGVSGAAISRWERGSRAINSLNAAGIRSQTARWLTRRKKGDTNE